MRYIKSFTNDNAIQAAVDDKSLGKPYVALDEATGKIDWNGKVNARSVPLTFEILSDGNIVLGNNSVLKRTVQYSKNGGEWISVNFSGATINVNTGDVVRFVGDNPYYNGNNFTNSTCTFKLKGNIMSLINSQNYDSLSVLTDDNTFSNMFRSCSGLLDAGELLMPATSLTDSCYFQMFYFSQNLITAPELPATTLSRACYNQMFNTCKKLNYVKCLAIDMTAEGCTSDWLKYASSTGTFVKKAGVTWPSGTSGIPSGWTVIEE